MPSSFTESIVEEAALAWFAGLGYTVLAGPTIAPGEPFAERDDYSQVLLTGRLRQALARLNPTSAPAALDEALRKLTRPDRPSLIRLFLTNAHRKGKVSQLLHMNVAI
jgi:type I restriction enzyme R subunit